MMRRRLALTTLLFLFTTTAPAQTPKKTAPLPGGGEALIDLAYVNNGHVRQSLDLYLPKSDRPLPLVIWIHGGGWQNGDKANPPLLPLLKKGFAVASINYRLSQHAIFPAQIHDCKAAVRFLRANAKKYNLDPSRFGVGGGSAGGHLAALLGATGDVKELEGTLGDHVGVSSRVQAVWDLYGPTDFTMFDNLGPKSAPTLLLGGLPKDKAENARLVNPINFVTPDDPPFLIIHGDQDKLVPIRQSEALHAALTKAGVPSTYTRIPNAGHGGPAFATPEIRSAIEAFFQKHLMK